MRLPGQCPGNLHRGADAAVRIGKTLLVDFRNTLQQAARDKAATATGHGIGKAQHLQFLHQGNGVVVAQRHGVHVSHRQCKAGPLQQATGFTQVNHRRNARADTAGDFTFSLQPAGAQFA